MAENGRTKTYILDSSAWIAIDGNPNSNTIRSALLILLDDGRLKAPRQVFAELIRCGEFSGWAKANRRKIAYPRRMNAEYAANVGLVQHTFPSMSRALGSRERADVWVVAAVLTESAKGVECCAVTTETPGNRPNRKIPGACAALGLECISIERMLEDEIG